MRGLPTAVTDETALLRTNRLRNSEAQRTIRSVVQLKKSAQPLFGQWLQTRLVLQKRSFQIDSSWAGRGNPTQTRVLAAIHVALLVCLSKL